MRPEAPQIDEFGSPVMKAGQTTSLQRQVDRGYRRFMQRRGLMPNDDFIAKHKNEARAATARMLRKLADGTSE